MKSVIPLLRLLPSTKLAVKNLRFTHALATGARPSLAPSVLSGSRKLSSSQPWHISQNPSQSKSTPTTNSTNRKKKKATPDALKEKSRPQGKEKKKRPDEPKVDPRLHFKAFFSRYPGFSYRPLQPVMSEYYLMCKTLWPSLDREDPVRQEAWKGIRDALTKQFNSIYGTDEKVLSSWQNLCVVLQFRHIPDKLDACREVVASTFVNLVDLVDTPVTRLPVELFASEIDLSVYTKQTKKIFPLESAYAGGLLKFLLRRIIVPGRGLAHPSQ